MLPIIKTSVPVPKMSTIIIFSKIFFNDIYVERYHIMQESFFTNLGINTAAHS